MARGVRGLSVLKKVKAGGSGQRVASNNPLFNQQPGKKPINKKQVRQV